jgi:hypothetical protein
MNETTVRDLFQQAMADAEPPPGPQILGNAVRSASRTRRRQRAASLGAAAVVVPGLAVGVAAAMGALSPAASAGHPGSGTVPGAAASPHSPENAVRPARHRAVRPRFSLVFERPRGLVEQPEVNPVPITNQSLGQLLIDDLPAGARHGQIQGTVNPLPNAAPVTDRTVYAQTVVTTSTGTGHVEATISVAGAQSSDFGCNGYPDCRDYSLPGGVIVEESYQLPAGAGIMLDVTVFRPSIAEFDIGEANSGTAQNGMPLTMAQMLKVALDGRWQFAISQQFVAQASGLKVAPMPGS